MGAQVNELPVGKPREEVPDFHDDTHVMGEDGLAYKKVIVSATGVAAGLHVDGQEKIGLNVLLEQAMTDAIHQAHDDGVGGDDDEVRRRIHAARDAVLAEQG